MDDLRVAPFQETPHGKSGCWPAKMRKNMSFTVSPGKKWRKNMILSGKNWGLHPQKWSTLWGITRRKHPSPSLAVATAAPSQEQDTLAKPMARSWKTTFLTTDFCSAYLGIYGLPSVRINFKKTHAGTVLMAPAAAGCLQSLGGQWPLCYLLGRAGWGFLM